jgi:hypothetical protein
MNFYAHLTFFKIDLDQFDNSFSVFNQCEHRIYFYRSMFLSLLIQIKTKLITKDLSEKKNDFFKNV